MKFYTSYFKWGNCLYTRGYTDKHGSPQQFFEVEELTDINLYTISDKPTTSDRYSLYGNKPLVEHNFSSVKEANKFINSYDGPNASKLYGYPKFDVVKINQLYPGEIQYNPQYIKIMYIDIETFVNDDTDTGRPATNKFPNVWNSEHAINLITCIIDKSITVLALGQVDQNYIKSKLPEYTSTKYSLKIKQFTTEKQLLATFTQLMSTEKPDIISGWNVEGFDMPYIHTRMSKHFSEKYITKLSPFGIVHTRNSYDSFGNNLKIVVIQGVSILDYLHLYKKFEASPRPNYKLETISSLELGVGKLSYDGSFQQFYREHFSKDFTLYNIIDVIRVQDLERVCGFLSVAYSMAYEAKSNYIDVMSVTRLWDNIIFIALEKQNIEVPTIVQAETRDYEGAFVKPVIPGKYDYLVTFDVGSLYPSTMMQNNISPETLAPDVVELTPYDVTHRTEKFTVAKQYALEHNLALCSNGRMFYKDRKGIIPVLLGHYAKTRNVAKTEAKDRQRLVEYAHERLNKLQSVTK